MRCSFVRRTCRSPQTEIRCPYLAAATVIRGNLDLHVVSALHNTIMKDTHLEARPMYSPLICMRLFAVERRSSCHGGARRGSKPILLSA